MDKNLLQEGKALIMSTTFWFNILTGFVAVAMFFGFGGFEPSPEMGNYIGLINAIGNIFLRLKTTQPINRIK